MKITEGNSTIIKKPIKYQDLHNGDIFICKDSKIANNWCAIVYLLVDKQEGLFINLHNSSKLYFSPEIREDYVFCLYPNAELFLNDAVDSK